MYTKKKFGGTSQMQLTFGNRLRATIIGGGASLILATAALAAPVLAADQPTAAAAAANDIIGTHTHQLHGVVKSAGGSSFVLTTERYGDVTVSFTVPTPKGHAQAHGKARSHELASLADLKVGERLVVQGHTLVSGTTLTFVARRVHVLPDANGDGHATTHLVGNVSGATATTLNVTLADGTIKIVTVSADTRIKPEGKTLASLTKGTRVTVVIKNGTATGIVVMPT
jgi:hypothetical protein